MRLFACLIVAPQRRYDEPILYNRALRLAKQDGVCSRRSVALSPGSKGKVERPSGWVRERSSSPARARHWKAGEGDAVTMLNSGAGVTLVRWRGVAPVPTLILTLCVPCMSPVCRTATWLSSGTSAGAWFERGSTIHSGTDQSTSVDRRRAPTLAYSFNAYVRPRS